ncbi:MAG: hypothetical protein ENTB_01870 [Enterocloster aldenensis]
MSRVFTTTLRLNLDDPDDYRAWERLRRLDKRQYRSYSKAIVAAVNAFFDRQERLADDPYLETREKEDAFLRRVLEAVETGLRAAPAVMLPQAAISPATGQEENAEDMEAALDFADSF